jgi:hypothetical protein
MDRETDRLTGRWTGGHIDVGLDRRAVRQADIFVDLLNFEKSK